MAERKKGFEIFIEENISEHNVMRMGELLALNALRVMCRYENFHGMYSDIVRDIQYKDLDGSLTKEEKETIDGYMAGISVTQQARLFNVYNSTIWRRRKRVQDKYLAIEVTL